MSRRVIFAVDPGPTESAWVRFVVGDSARHSEPGRVLVSGKAANALVPVAEAARDGGQLVIEMIRGYGMRVGQEVFDTCVWTGRFMEQFESRAAKAALTIDRPTVKLYVCKNRQARDADVRAALIEMWGGKEIAIGKKKAPGPLYGLKGDTWAALAVAVAFERRRLDGERIGVAV